MRLLKVQQSTRSTDEISQKPGPRFLLPPFRQSCDRQLHPLQPVCQLAPNKYMYIKWVQGSKDWVQKKDVVLLAKRRNYNFC